MLKRKITEKLLNWKNNEDNICLLVRGARQVGKTYIIDEFAKKNYKSYIYINFELEPSYKSIFDGNLDIKTLKMKLELSFPNTPLISNDTIIFLDEIQACPNARTALKSFAMDNTMDVIASGSLLGLYYKEIASYPVGYEKIIDMYPLDFEEYLLAMGCGQKTIDGVRDCYKKREPLNDSMHNYMLQQFKLYLLVGGMPDAINKFLENRNITQVRNIQRNIHSLYRIDASQYDEEKKLVIRNIYDLIPSNMENKKKRIIIKNIEGKNGHKQFSDYVEEFEYLTNSGVALQVRAISNPKFPLLESESKNLLKLYLSDVGLLTNLLYGTNINAVLGDMLSINLGSVYETVVAQELHAHGFQLHYYDNKQRGEVDFLIDDYDNLTVLPIEVKSGKVYKVHSALDKFIATPDYHISRAIVLSNEQNVYEEHGIMYMPIYYVMFMENKAVMAEDCIIPEIPVVPK